MSDQRKLITQLRKITSAGMLHCKKALDATKNDLKAAVSWLREQGIAKSVSKLSREAKQGVVCAYIDANSKVGSLIEVNSETDFVARNEKFQAFVSRVAEISINYDSVLSLLDANFNEGIKVKDEVSNNIAVIGEKIVIGNMKKIHTKNNGILGSYIHNLLGENSGNIATICALTTNDNISLSNDKIQVVETLARNISLHIATMCNSEDTDENALPIQELLKQNYILDEKMSLADLLNNVGKEIETSITISCFIRLQVGG